MYLAEGYNTHMSKQDYLEYKGCTYDIKNVYAMLNGNKYYILSVNANLIGDMEIILCDYITKKTLIIQDLKDNIDYRIDSIMPMIKVVKNNNYVDTEEIANGVLLYIIAMIGSLIFKDFLMGWAMASFIFWPWIIKKLK